MLLANSTRMSPGPVTRRLAAVGFVVGRLPVAATTGSGTVVGSSRNITEPTTMVGPLRSDARTGSVAPGMVTGSSTVGASSSCAGSVIVSSCSLLGKILLRKGASRSIGVRTCLAYNSIK